MSASRLLLNYTHQTQLNQKKVIINNKYHLCTPHNEKSEKINKTKYYSTSNNTYILHKYKYIHIILSNAHHKAHIILYLSLTSFTSTVISLFSLNLGNIRLTRPQSLCRVRICPFSTSSS